MIHVLSLILIIALAPTTIKIARVFYSARIREKDLEKAKEKRIYNSSGIEVKMAKFVGFAPGYQCPTCGMIHCCHDHCLRCGQPLVYDEWQLEHYHETYKDVNEEIATIDEQMGIITQKH